MVSHTPPPPPPPPSSHQIIALRLYTGPAYVPINVFLREVAKLGPDWRRKVARWHRTTYAATVSHLYSALRKLVRVNQQTKLTVYRGEARPPPTHTHTRNTFVTLCLLQV
jgi:hypothetical protein